MNAVPRNVIGFCPLWAAHGGSIPKRVGGFCCNPCCQKSTYELPWPSSDTANFLATKDSRERASVGESGWNKPALKRSRTKPIAALYSSVSRSLTNLPELSRRQLFGALNICAYPPRPNSESLVPMLPI